MDKSEKLKWVSGISALISAVLLARLSGLGNPKSFEYTSFIISSSVLISSGFLILISKTIKADDPKPVLKKIFIAFIFMFFLSIISWIVYRDSRPIQSEETFDDKNITEMVLEIMIGTSFFMTIGTFWLCGCYSSEKMLLSTGGSFLEKNLYNDKHIQVTYNSLMGLTDSVSGTNLFIYVSLWSLFHSVLCDYEKTNISIPISIYNNHKNYESIFNQQIKKHNIKLTDSELKGILDQGISIMVESPHVRGFGDLSTFADLKSKKSTELFRKLNMGENSGALKLNYNIMYMIYLIAIQFQLDPKSTDTIEKALHQFLVHKLNKSLKFKGKMMGDKPLYEDLGYLHDLLDIILIREFLMDMLGIDSTKYVWGKTIKENTKYCIACDASMWRNKENMDLVWEEAIKRKYHILKIGTLKTGNKDMNIAEAYPLAFMIPPESMNKVNRFIHAARTYNTLIA